MRPPCWPRPCAAFSVSRTNALRQNNEKQKKTPNDAKKNNKKTHAPTPSLPIPLSPLLLTPPPISPSSPSLPPPLSTPLPSPPPRPIDLQTSEKFLVCLLFFFKKKLFAASSKKFLSSTCTCPPTSSCLLALLPQPRPFGLSQRVLKPLFAGCPPPPLCSRLCSRLAWAESSLLFDLYSFALLCLPFFYLLSTGSVFVLPRECP